MNYDYDVIIVGCGPAGIFSAYTIIEKFESGNLKFKPKILIIDKGKDVEERKCALKEIKKCVLCEPCNIMCGVGGAGIFSDGLLNLRPDIGGNLMEFINEKESWELVNKVDEIFVKFGAPKEIYPYNKEDVENLKRKASSVGVKFVEIKQRHMGSDGAIRVIKNFENYLKNKGVEILLSTEVDDIIVEENKCIGVYVKNEKRKIFSKVTLLCPGRI
ncbi:MAG: FAD-dependent oxidoreductase, partial [Candidatus Altarchaeaceae archaeon]